MTVSLYTGEEAPRPLDIEVFTPDPELYPGKVFNSFSEMMKNCPLLEQRSEAANGGYVPYTVETVPRIIIQGNVND